MSIDEQSTDQAEELPAPDAIVDGDQLSDDASAPHDRNANEIQPVYDHPPIVESYPQRPAFPSAPRRKGSASEWLPLGLSVAFHAALIAIGFLLLVRFKPPTWSFQKGDGTSTSDFSAANSDPNNGRANMPAAPVVGTADPNLKLAQKSQQSDESLLMTDPETFATPPAPQQEPQAEQSSFGIPPSNPLNDPPPARPKPAPPVASQAQTEEDHGNSTVAPSAPQFAAKPQSAMNAPVQKSHVWTEIHPSGAGGSGSRAGSRNGYDERGLPIPEYPAESLRRGEEGLVLLEVEVRADGSVYNVTVLNDGGFPRLAAAALEAVRTRAHFTPATYDGQPTIAKIPLPYQFVINTRR